MWEKLKAFWLWLYNWLTVIGAVIVGGASTALQVMDGLAAIDFTSFLPANTALKIIVGIALFKWLCVAIIAIRDRMTREAATQ